MFIVKNVSKSISGKTLFENISFSVLKGDKVALVGPNGSGKSTFLKILAGLEDHDSGSIEMLREVLAYVPQEAPSDQNLGNFSGGQKTKIMIEKAMASNPTVLLLDEPTNHLDKEGLIWFRGLIQSFKGSVFAISHDREFLEDMDKIFEINPEDYSFNFYVGGWTEYKQQSQERMIEHENNYHNQQKEKHRLEERLKWRQIQANAHSNPNLGAQIRMMQRRLEREIYSQEITKPKSNKTISKVNLYGSAHNSKLLLSLRDVDFSVDAKPVLKNISFEVRGKERVVIRGKNGSGKSTVLKIIVGILFPEKGVVKIGTNVNVGYFAQEHEFLNGEETVLESYESTERLESSSDESHSILASFLFTNNELNKRVKDLSPGERVRLIFAKLTHQKNELLILDEPTNHLDIQSKEIIEDALRSFEGGILVVSHDKYFIESLKVNKELSIESGKLFIK